MALWEIVAFATYIVCHVSGLVTMDARTTAERVVVDCSVSGLGEDIADTVNIWNNRQENITYRTHLRSRQGDADEHRCTRVLSASVGSTNPFANCTLRTDHMLSVALQFSGLIPENVLGTWSCTAIHRNGTRESAVSTALYRQAAVSDFPDEPIEQHLEAPIVQYHDMTSTGRVIIQCLTKAIYTMIVRPSSITVPRKPVTFTFSNGTATSVDMYDRLVTTHRPVCPADRSEVPNTRCFGDGRGIGSDCAEAFTYLTEAPLTTEEFVPEDVTLSYMFGESEEDQIGRLVRLRRYLVIDDPPRSHTCHHTVTGGHTVCLAGDKFKLFLQEMIDKSLSFTTVSLRAVRSRILECAQGTIVALLTEDCLEGGTRTCDASAGFATHTSEGTITLVADYAVRDCTLTHYYCFRGRRKRLGTLVVVDRYTEAKQDTFTQVTSPAVMPTCESSRGEKNINFSSALPAGVKRIKHWGGSCPCVQVPRPCVDRPHVVGTLVLPRKEFARQTVTCTVLGRTSTTPVPVADILHEAACSTRDAWQFLPQPRVVVARTKALVAITCQSSACSDSDMALTVRKRYEPGVATFVGKTIVGLDEFVSRYTSIECGWSSQFNEQAVNGTFALTTQDLVDLYDGAMTRQACIESGMYTVEIVHHESRYTCYAARLDPVCAPIASITFGNETCVRLDCGWSVGGNELMLDGTGQCIAFDVRGKVLGRSTGHSNTRTRWCDYNAVDLSLVTYSVNGVVDVTCRTPATFNRSCANQPGNVLLKVYAGHNQHDIGTEMEQGNYTYHRDAENRNLVSTSVLRSWFLFAARNGKSVYAVCGSGGIPVYLVHGMLVAYRRMASEPTANDSAVRSVVVAPKNIRRGTSKVMYSLGAGVGIVALCIGLCTIGIACITIRRLRGQSVVGMENDRWVLMGWTPGEDRATNIH